MRAMRAEAFAVAAGELRDRERAAIGLDALAQPALEAGDV